MQLNLKSQHRQQAGKKIHKTQQNIFFRHHIRRAELLAFSQQGSHPAKFQPKRKATQTKERQAQYNSSKMKINHFSGDTDYRFYWEQRRKLYIYFFFIKKEN